MPDVDGERCVGGRRDVAEGVSKGGDDDADVMCLGEENLPERVLWSSGCPGDLSAEVVVRGVGGVELVEAAKRSDGLAGSCEEDIVNVDADDGGGEIAGGSEAEAGRVALGWGLTEGAENAGEVPDKLGAALGVAVNAALHLEEGTIAGCEDAVVGCLLLCVEEANEGGRGLYEVVTDEGGL